MDTTQSVKQTGFMLVTTIFFIVVLGALATLFLSRHTALRGLVEQQYWQLQVDNMMVFSKQYFNRADHRTGLCERDGDLTLFTDPLEVVCQCINQDNATLIVIAFKQPYLQSFPLSQTFTLMYPNL
jgi:hypothetical protein